MISFLNYFVLDSKQQFEPVWALLSVFCRLLECFDLYLLNLGNLHDVLRTEKDGFAVLGNMIR